ncbi:MAG: signal peptidase II, partial [Spirochaetia bacterium]|nr:signal peptidase II [Spirochaetia bacterium]
MKFISFLHFDFIAQKRNKILFFFLIVAGLLSLDILSKIWVERHLVEVYDPAKKLQLGEIPFEYYRDYGDDTKLIKHDIVVVPTYFILTYVRNYDIGFSILSFLDNWMLPDTKSIVMKSVQLLAVLLASVYFFYTGLRYYLPFTLIITGGLGNVI